MPYMPPSRRPAPSEFIIAMQEVKTNSGLSNAQFGRAVGCDRTHISGMFNGRRRAERSIVISVLVLCSITPMRINEILFSGGYSPVVPMWDSSMDLLSGTLSRLTTLQKHDDFAELKAEVMRLCYEYIEHNPTTNINGGLNYNYDS